MLRKPFMAVSEKASSSWAVITRLIVSQSADLDMAVRSIFFGAVGTAGQRCTSTRRVIAQESIARKASRPVVRRV